MNLVVKKVTSEESFFVCLCDRANVTKSTKKSYQKSNQHHPFASFSTTEMNISEAKICMILVFEEIKNSEKIETI